jgi:hypothetical protein
MDAMVADTHTAVWYLDEPAKLSGLALLVYGQPCPYESS